MTNELTQGRRGEDLPQARREALAWDAAGQILDRVNDSYSFASLARLVGHPGDLDLRKAKAALQGLQAAGQQLAELRDHLADFSRPASKRAITALIGRLTGLYSIHNIGDPALFGRVMLEKVGSKEPAIGVLAQACEHLIETKKFLPSIAEVLEAIENQNAHLRAWQHMVENLPSRQSELAATIAAAEEHAAKVEASRQRMQAEARERERQKVRDAIQTGASDDSLELQFDASLLAEVRADIAPSPEATH